MAGCSAEYGLARFAASFWSLRRLALSRQQSFAQKLSCWQAQDRLIDGTPFEENLVARHPCSPTFTAFAGERRC
jgi:hypothetical protein